MNSRQNSQAQNSAQADLNAHRLRDQFTTQIGSFSLDKMVPLSLVRPGGVKESAKNWLKAKILQESPTGNFSGGLDPTDYITLISWKDLLILEPDTRVPDSARDLFPIVDGNTRYELLRQENILSYPASMVTLEGVHPRKDLGNFCLDSWNRLKAFYNMDSGSRKGSGKISSRIFSFLRNACT